MSTLDPEISMARRTRHVCSTLLLVPLGLLVSHEAGAAGSLRPAIPDEPGTAAPLPDGIHDAGGGRYTRDLCDHKKHGYCLTRVLMPESWKPGDPNPYGPQGIRREANPPAGSMGPSDIMTAYNIPASTAANGKIVAILDMYDSHAWDDLNVYRTAYGIPALPQCTGNPTGSLPACFLQVAQDGSPASGWDSGDSNDTETSLDMDMVSAACPDCSILVVNFSEFDDQDLFASVATATSMGASAVTISWGYLEGYGGAGGAAGRDPIGNYYTKPGTLVLAAAGDDGYLLVNNPWSPSQRTPSYPSSAPDILAIGGTNLFSLGNSKYDEAVWNDLEGVGQMDVTTSGCSTEFSALAWQATALAGTGCTMRATADTAAAAAFTSGGVLTDIACYEAGYGFSGVEGTSASSPMTAAILTRLNLTDTISSNLGWAYANPGGFRDLGSTSYPVDPNGSNTDSIAKHPTCGTLCIAGPGWDGPSGMGTPNGQALWTLSNGGTVDAGFDAGWDSGSSSSSSASSSSNFSSSSSSSASSVSSSSSSSSSSASSSSSSSSSVSSSSSSSASSVSSSSSSSASSVSSSSSSSASSIRSSSSWSSSSATSSASSGVVDSGVDSGHDSGTIGSSTSSTAAASSKQPIGTKDSGTTPPSTDATVADAAGSPAGSSGGCSCTESSESRSGWSSLGWLSVGLLALAQRRRRAGRP